MKQLESYYVMKKYSTGKIDRKWGHEEIKKDDSYYFLKNIFLKQMKL